MTLLTAAQAAEILKRTARSVRFYIAKGQLPACKLGRDWLIRREGLEKFEPPALGRPRKKKAGL